MNNIKYDMSFEDVFHEIFHTGGWYQGEEFRNGVYISAPKSLIVVKIFSDGVECEKFECPLGITKGLMDMKFRRVYNKNQLERKS